MNENIPGHSDIRVLLIDSLKSIIINYFPFLLVDQQLNNEMDPVKFIQLSIPNQLNQQSNHVNIK